MRNNVGTLFVWITMSLFTSSIVSTVMLFPPELKSLPAQMIANQAQTSNTQISVPTRDEVIDLSENTALRQLSIALVLSGDEGVESALEPVAEAEPVLVETMIAKEIKDKESTPAVAGVFDEPAPTFTPVPEPVKSLLDLVNDYRQQIQRVPFQEDENLCKAAEMSASYILDYGDWSHSFLLRNADTIVDRSVYPLLGENLARDFDTDAEVLEAWLNSPPHRDNVAHAVYNSACVRVRENIVVMIFAQKL